MRPRGVPSRASIPAPDAWRAPAILAGLLLAEGTTAFAALAFELSAARLVAPFAGASTDTWTAIIAAFLLAWALGTHLGGVLAAGRFTEAPLLPAAVASAAGGFAALATPALLPAWDALVLAPAPLEAWRVAVFAGVPCIPAGFCLGVSGPLVMHAVIRLTRGSGAAIGAANAMGAAGSVLGALAALWVLLDGLGTRGTVAAVAAIGLGTAILLSVLHAPWRRRA